MKKKKFQLEVPGGADRVLLHTCCAPCSSAIIECLMQHGITPVIYYCNPNIYPLEEYNIRKDEVLHADFLQVTEDKPITVTLPVRTEGTSPGVMRGGKLKVRIPRLKVKGLIKDLPAFVMVNISELNVNQAIRVKDLTIENVTPLVAANNIVCDVKAKKSAITEETEE